MNRWNEIWNKRTSVIEAEDDIFSMFCKLKSANGFDTQDEEGYYESFFKEWQRMEEMIHSLAGDYESVYEVGCGSGVNLYLFNKLVGINKLGGIDYSDNLIKVAKSCIESEDIASGEADFINNEKYDIVLSDSVFQYFPDSNYGESVLRKMLDKAKRVVAVTEIHDLDKMSEHMAYRRSMVENYDEKYAGLDKTFYSKEMFERVAKECGYECKFVLPTNDIYWNNKFVFDCYMVRK